MQYVPSVCIIGSGVVGQATGHGFLRRGINVTFVDTNLDKVQSLRSEGLTAYTPSELSGTPLATDISILTVSTPTQGGKINLDYFRSAVEELGRRLAITSEYHVVVVRSTVVPGTTEDLVIPTLEKMSGKKAGQDFGVCMNPEYLREKTSVQDFDQPWIVVIGQLDERSGDVVARLYQDFDCPLHRLPLKAAETQKYVHNLFNAVKITFFNEFRGICALAGVDAEAIFPLVAKSCEGMWNAEYGIKDFGAFSGMCLPKDTQAFLHWAQTNQWEMPLLKTTIAVNDELLKKEAAQREVATAEALVAATAGNV